MEAPKAQKVFTTKEIWEHKFDAERNAGYREPYSFTEKDAKSLVGKPKAIILPGNGVDDVADCMWYPWMKEKLEELGYSCVLTIFPDPMVARESLWKGFVLQCIGHSSGAACAMRILEEGIKVKGVVLVSAYHTDLGDSYERKSGYFSRPWKWESMKKNADWIVQVHAKDDHLVPVREARFVHEHAGTEYHEFEEYGHFQTSDVPELLEILKKKLQ